LAQGGAVSELRTGKRFPLELPIKIHDKQSSKKHAATSSNLSAAGVFIWADMTFEVGSPIKFDITLPGKVVGARGDVAIECSGRVVRSDKTNSALKKIPMRGNKRGVACVIDSYKFVRG
jgi:hypothetical protein